jgi:hypothetical protein
MSPLRRGVHRCRSTTTALQGASALDRQPKSLRESRHPLVHWHVRVAGDTTCALLERQARGGARHRDPGGRSSKLPDCGPWGNWRATHIASTTRKSAAGGDGATARAPVLPGSSRNPVRVVTSPHFVTPDATELPHRHVDSPKDTGAKESQRHRRQRCPVAVMASLMEARPAYRQADGRRRSRHDQSTAAGNAPGKLASSSARPPDRQPSRSPQKASPLPTGAVRRSTRSPRQHWARSAEDATPRPSRADRTPAGGPRATLRPSAGARPLSRRRRC